MAEWPGNDVPHDDAAGVERMEELFAMTPQDQNPWQQPADQGGWNGAAGGWPAQSPEAAQPKSRRARRNQQEQRTQPAQQWPQQPQQWTSGQQQWQAEQQQWPASDVQQWPAPQADQWQPAPAPEQQSVDHQWPAPDAGAPDVASAAADAGWSQQAAWGHSAATQDAWNGSIDWSVPAPGSVDPAVPGRRLAWGAAADSTPAHGVHAAFETSVDRDLQQQAAAVGDVDPWSAHAGEWAPVEPIPTPPAPQATGWELPAADAETPQRDAAPTPAVDVAAAAHEPTGPASAAHPAAAPNEEPAAAAAAAATEDPAEHAEFAESVSPAESVEPEHAVQDNPLGRLIGATRIREDAEIAADARAAMRPAPPAPAVDPIDESEPVRPIVIPAPAHQLLPPPPQPGLSPAAEPLLVAPSVAQEEVPAPAAQAVTDAETHAETDAAADAVPAPDAEPALAAESALAAEPAPIPDPVPGPDAAALPEPAPLPERAPEPAVIDEVPAAVDASLASALDPRLDALEYSEEVSAVLGAPDAGGPRSAASSVSAQHRAEDESRPGLPAADERSVSVAVRPAIWTLHLPDGSAVQLTSDTVVLGRRPDSDDAAEQRIAVTDATRTISKTHAQLTRLAGAWMITDLGSTNGIVLLGADGTETELQNGRPRPVTERFLLGDAELRLTSSTE